MKLKAALPVRTELPLLVSARYCLFAGSIVLHQWYMARAHIVTGATFDAVGQIQLLELLQILVAGIGIELLRQ